MQRISVFVRLMCVSAAVITLTSSVSAQVSVTGYSSTSINFSSTVPGVTNGTFTGSGFQPNPAAGQLDSDAWAITGWSDGDLGFGSSRTATATDYARGNAAGAVTTGGIYAQTLSGFGPPSPSLMVQPGSGDFAPGTITLRIQNNTSRNLVRVALFYKLLVRNDQARSSSFNLSYSTDDATYTAHPSLDYTSPEAADASGWTNVSGGAGWRAFLSGFSVAPGGYFYVRWTSADVGGTGSRDEFGLDDINIVPILQPLEVTSTDDTNDGVCDSHCTLREAIAAAINGDTIQFSSHFGTAKTINLGSVLRWSNKNLTLSGPGARLLTLAGSGSEQVFWISNSTVTISGMTITGGRSAVTGVGGAIAAYNGSLTLERVHVTGNTANNAGGAVYSESGQLYIRQSTISGNTGTNRCGGVLVFMSFTSQIVNTTLSGNNGGSGWGGAVCAESSSNVEIRNSTITANTAATGGGIYVGSFNSASLYSTILAGNTATSGSGPEIFNAGSVSSIDFNLIGDSAGDSANTGAATIAYKSTDIQDTSPGLAALAYYGGDVPVHALLITPASPALDQGSAFFLTTDARGFDRIYDDAGITNASGGDGTDIGAYERLGPTAAGVSLSGRVIDANGRGIAGVRVRLQGPNGSEPRAAITSTFGYYRFDDLEAGAGYVISVKAKRHTFEPSTHFVTLNDDAVNVNFEAVPSMGLNAAYRGSAGRGNLSGVNRKYFHAATWQPATSK